MNRALPVLENADRNVRLQMKQENPDYNNYPTIDKVKYKEKQQKLEQEFEKVFNIEKSNKNVFLYDNKKDKYVIKKNITENKIKICEDNNDKKNN